MSNNPKNTIRTKDPIRDIGHYLLVFQTYLGSRIYLIFALALFAAVMEGLGILMLLPLLHGLDKGSEYQNSESDSRITTLLNDALSFFGLQDSTVAILLVITSAFLFKGVLVFLATGYDAYLRATLLRRLKERLFTNYTHMTYDYYTKQNTGHFLNIINAQIDNTLLAFKSLTNVGAQLLNAIIYTILAFAVAWRFGLMTLLLGILLLAMFRWINIYARNLSRQTSAESGVLEKSLIQALQSHKYLAATGQARSIARNVFASINRLTKYKTRSGIAGAFTGAVREPILVVSIMVIVLAQLVFFEQPLAPILVSIILFQRGLGAILSIQQAWQQLLGSAGGIEMVRDEFERQQRFREPEGHLSASNLSESIKLEQVTFAYSADNGNIITDFNLEIRAKTSVALIGESGAGKSTVLDLITLMVEPDQGEVLIDGVSGKLLKRETWRGQIGFVSQEAIIFDDTVANNICLWAGDHRADSELDARIIRAAQQAHLEEFIDGLPESYETVVGDRGVRLSGGQRQRLFIARELFRQPNLLILDEATSALDSESERKIQESIDRLKGEITVIIVAHRLSTIRNVDRVYVLSEGRIVEEGSYCELRNNRRSRLCTMIDLQKV